MVHFLVGLQFPLFLDHTNKLGDTDGNERKGDPADDCHDREIRVAVGPFELLHEEAARNEEGSMQPAQRAQTRTAILNPDIRV